MNFLTNLKELDMSILFRYIGLNNIKVIENLEALTLL